ncbi:MAG: hypothetical protein JWN76_2426 [Chitinophagaceae bacterium]|nr:hypothetical protein [Chitinophagaceae bacterium]
MHTEVLAAIYQIVKENKNIPLLPNNISATTGILETNVLDIFKDFEEKGFVEKKYVSFNVYNITRDGFISAEGAYNQYKQKT